MTVVLGFDGWNYTPWQLKLLMVITAPIWLTVSLWRYLKWRLGKK